MTMINPKQTTMSKQDPQARAKNFNEVGLGYTKEEAISEAKRCLKCKKPPCVAGCPVSIDIAGVLEEIEKQAEVKV